MNHPVLTNNLAQVRYNEMLTEAQVARRRNQQTGPRATLAQRLGKALVVAGQKLNATQVQPEQRLAN